MYRLMRVYTDKPGSLVFDLWDFYNITGFEIIIRTSKILNKLKFANHFIGRTETITFWDELITMIKKASDLKYESFRK